MKRIGHVRWDLSPLWHPHMLFVLSNSGRKQVAFPASFAGTHRLQSSGDKTWALLEWRVAALHRQVWQEMHAELHENGQGEPWPWNPLASVGTLQRCERAAGHGWSSADPAKEFFFYPLRGQPRFFFLRRTSDQSICSLLVSWKYWLKFLSLKAKHFSPDLPAICYLLNWVCIFPGIPSFPKEQRQVPFLFLVPIALAWLVLKDRNECIARCGELFFCWGILQGRG